MKNKVIRTYREGWTVTTDNLEQALKEGWLVKMCTPIQDKSGTYYCNEYILEKEDVTNK